MGQTSRRADWDPLLSPEFLRHGAYFVPAGSYDWTRDGLRSYTPDLEVPDEPGAWHPDDALMVPLRSASGEVLGIVGVDEPVTGRRPSQVELELLERRRRARRDRGRAGPEHRRGPPPPRRRRAPPARVLPAHGPQLGGGHARRRLRRHPRGARLPEGDGVPRRPPRRPPRADVGRRLHGRAGRGLPAVPARGPPAAARRGVRAPRLRRHGPRLGPAPHAARHPRHLLVGQQRARAAGVVAPLARRAAARPRRPARRHGVGGRPRGLRAPLRRVAAGAAGVREPGDERDRVRAPARQPAPPRRPRPAHRAAQPPRLRAGHQRQPRRARLSRRAVAAGARPRPLQARQRLARPRRGRRRAAALRRRAADRERCR